MICALLLGANLDVKFWPHAFCHALHMSIAFPEPSQSQSTVRPATGESEDFSNVRTFGCCVWVGPLGHGPAKLKPTH